MENKNNDIYEIFTIPVYKGNAYIMETAGNGGCEFLWTAPLLEDGTVDNTQWGLVEGDYEVNTVIDSVVFEEPNNKKTVLGEIAVEDFNKLIGVA